MFDPSIDNGSQTLRNDVFHVCTNCFSDFDPGDYDIVSLDVPVRQIDGDVDAARKVLNLDLCTIKLSQ